MRTCTIKTILEYTAYYNNHKMTDFPGTLYIIYTTVQLSCRCAACNAIAEYRHHHRFDTLDEYVKKTFKIIYIYIKIYMINARSKPKQYVIIYSRDYYKMYILKGVLQLFIGWSFRFN